MNDIKQRAWLTGLIRKTDGAAAVEFALIAFPFFMSVLGLIYIGLLYWSASALDKSVDKVGQLFYEGRPLCGSAAGATSPYTADCLRQRVCEQNPLVFVSEAKCKAGALRFDLRVLKADGTDTFPEMISNHAINPGAFADMPGAVPGKIVMIRAALEVPNLAWVGPGVGVSSGTRVVTAATAFRMRDMATYSSVPAASP